MIISSYTKTFLSKFFKSRMRSTVFWAYQAHMTLFFVRVLLLSNLAPVALLLDGLHGCAQESETRVTKNLLKNKANAYILMRD